MKIAYFINTFQSINWGGQATSNGIKHMLKLQYPNAEFEPLNIPALPFKKIKILRAYVEKKLLNAILNDQVEDVIKYLKYMNISEDIFDDYTHVCFNGEGSVHYKSGHLIRHLGLLYLAKIKKKYVATVNQTIDLNNDKKLSKLLSKVYNMCDFISVREPLSFEVAKEIGILDCQLIPDAVYGLERLSQQEINQITNKYDLEEKNYITITASSSLQRNTSSLRKMEKLLDAIIDIFQNKEIVFMANAKTDIYIAKKLQKKYSLMIVNSLETSYREAIAIFANSFILIGGRQHPNIFAYMYKVPYLPFHGNTFKNKGVAMLQEYELSPINYELTTEEYKKSIKELLSKKLTFKDITISNFDILG